MTSDTFSSLPVSYRQSDSTDGNPFDRVVTISREALMRVQYQVSSFEIASGLHVVRTRNALVGDSSLSGRHAVLAKRSAVFNFGLTTTEGLLALHEERVDLESVHLDDLTVRMVGLDGYPISSASPWPRVWDALLCGEAQVYESLPHANGWLLLDVKTRTPLPQVIACEFLCEAILKCSPDDRETVMRVLLTIPGMEVSSIYGDNTSNCLREAMNALRVFMASRQHECIPLVWTPSQDIWGALMTGIVHEMRPGEGQKLEGVSEERGLSSFLSRNGSTYTYPYLLHDAAQEALLTLNPDVAKMMKMSDAPAVGR